MSRLRYSVAVLLVGLGAGLGASVADSEPVSAAVDVEATEKCEIPPERPTVNVVMLLDASGSLANTDPLNLRKRGLEAAIVNLAALARSNPDVDISVAVDVFATNYGAQHGYSEAREAQQALVGRYDNITALGKAGLGRTTDYRSAMRGVAERLRTAPPSGCNLLLWFTDGEHATEGTSSDVSEREWQQLRNLCSGADMESLSARSLYTVGVLLSSPDKPVNPAPLRHLFGDRAEGCEHELDGEISRDFNIDDLSDVLDELINEVVYEVSAESESDDDLPNEEPGVPDVGDYSQCDAGAGTRESPCAFSFSLGSEDESFRAFVDMTFLGREISDPEAVNFRLQSPAGELSDPIAAPASTEDAATGQYQPVRPFWFLSRRPYDSRWEIIGHQAAEQLVREGDWEWDGEWSLLFWGDDDEAAADARKVAAAVRTVTVDAPSADGMGRNEQGTLIGFIENYPSADYSSVELDLQPRDEAGEPLYSTRESLQCEPPTPCSPVVVSEGERRFEVPRLYDEIAYWDSEQAGGTGQALEEAVERGTVSLFAVLAREFSYGGGDGYGADGERGVPLRWTTDIGSITLDGMAAYLDGEQQWDEWVDWVRRGEPPALPFDVDLASPPLEVAGDDVRFAVTVKPGYLPGVIAIDRVSVRRGADTAPVEVPAPDWSCDVAGTRGRAAERAADCPEIEIDLGVSEDSDVIVELDFSIDPDPGLEAFVFSETMTVPSPGERLALSSEIQRAARPRSETVESEPFRVDVATPADKFNKFLPILVALVVLAALMRLLVAWRLRPWHKLDNAEYRTRRLNPGPDGQSGDHADEVDSCMALTGRAVKGTLGYVTLESAWGPLLAGRGPRIQATSTRGGCIGPAGFREGRGGRIGLIGEDLHEGWVVEEVDGRHYLVVWDLGDEPERSARVSEAADAARQELGALRPPSPAGGRNAGSQADGAAGGDGAATGRRPPSSDPFEASSDPFDGPQSPPDPFDRPDDPFGGDRDPFG